MCVADLKAAWAKSANSRSGSRYRLQKLGNRPYVIGNTSGHCRGATNSAVQTAVVVPSEIEGKGRLVILPFFREAVRQARQSANLHPHREILPFHMRCANPLWVGLPP